MLSDEYIIKNYELYKLAIKKSSLSEDCNKYSEEEMEYRNAFHGWLQAGNVKSGSENRFTSSKPVILFN